MKNAANRFSFLRLFVFGVSQSVAQLRDLLCVCFKFEILIMELPDLVLKDPKKSADIKRILSGLILDEATLERVREVFRREIRLGLQFGLEKVNIHYY